MGRANSDTQNTDFFLGRRLEKRRYTVFLIRNYYGCDCTLIDQFPLMPFKYSSEKSGADTNGRGARDYHYRSMFIRTSLFRCNSFFCVYIKERERITVAQYNEYLANS